MNTKYVILFIIVFIIIVIIIYYNVYNNKNNYITDDQQDAQVSQIFSSKQLTKTEKNTFSFSTWIYIDEFKTTTANKNIIFVTMAHVVNVTSIDLSNLSPLLKISLSKHTNKLIVEYGMKPPVQSKKLTITKVSNIVNNIYTLDINENAAVQCIDIIPKKCISIENEKYRGVASCTYDKYAAPMGIINECPALSDINIRVGDMIKLDSIEVEVINANASSMTVNDVNGVNGDTIKQLSSTTVTKSSKININSVITINNISLQTWVNIIVVINENVMEVYINGNLERTVSLTTHANHGIQNTNRIIVGDSKNGFVGQIANVEYYPYNIHSKQAREIFKTGYNKKWF
jgi:hypothetical protein